MVWHAYIDDSYTYPDGMFVLAGHIASAEAWIAFSKEWKEMLPLGTRTKSGFHFKMAEMAASPERMARVPAFYRIIERHVLISLSACFSMPDLRRAKDRISIPGRNIEWGFLENNYMFAFRVLMDMFHNHRDKISSLIPLDQKIDFYFDRQSERKKIMDAWDGYIEERPGSIRGLYGSDPRFEDDGEFLPLQAADFWAWWVRKWYEEGRADKIGTGDFGTWRIEREDYPRLAIDCNEDQIVDAIVDMVRSQEPGAPVVVR